MKLLLQQPACLLTVQGSCPLVPVPGNRIYGPPHLQLSLPLVEIGMSQPQGSGGAAGAVTVLWLSSARAEEEGWV